MENKPCIIFGKPYLSFEDEYVFLNCDASINNVINTFWFKYELIEWDILDTKEGKSTMIANLAIDSYHFQLSTASNSNNYATSFIRQFLINDFYNTAFSTLENAIMNTMSVDGNNDYVTILSKEEIETYYPNATDRCAKSTDYAKCCNVVNYAGSSNYYKNNCSWLTRSASDSANYVYCVNYMGNFSEVKVSTTYCGIRPVINVTL